MIEETAEPRRASHLHESADDDAGRAVIAEPLTRTAMGRSWLVVAGAAMGWVIGEWLRAQGVPELGWPVAGLLASGTVAKSTADWLGRLPSRASLARWAPTVLATPALIATVLAVLLPELAWTAAAVAAPPALLSARAMAGRGKPGAAVAVCGAHDPLRPSWDCRACAAPWPCVTAQQLLSDAYRTRWSDLGILLAILRDHAVMDLPNADPRQVGTRFIGWYRRRMRPQVGT